MKKSYHVDCEKYDSSASQENGDKNKWYALKESECVLIPTKCVLEIKGSVVFNDGEACAS